MTIQEEGHRREPHKSAGLKTGHYTVHDEPSAKVGAFPLDVVEEYD